MHILHFLGQTFEPSRDHISILHGGIFPRKDVSGNAVSDPLLLEDPLTPNNNVWPEMLSHFRNPSKMLERPI